MSHELDTFLERVKDRAGHSDVAVVEPAVRATLRALGSHLGGVPPAMHDAMPRVLRPLLAAGEDAETLRPAELYQRLAEELTVRVGVALELVQSTIAELAESIDEPAVELLRTSLPPAWVALMPEARDIEREQSRPVRAAKATEGSGVRGLTEGSGAHRLSGVRPGSSRPLADGPAPGGQADSIATSDDPHRDRLSTAHGPGPHEEGHTLAGGRPGSRRSVVDSDD